jgi:hypothetical protein
MSSPDAAAIAALEVLEVARERLHNSLREAAFSFFAAQREEESTRGCFVSYEAVPTQANTMTPLITVAQQTIGGGGEEEERTARAEAARASLWVLAVKEGDRKPAAPPREAAHRGGAAEEENSTKETGGTTPPSIDPVYYFSEHPSSALRECQAAYRRVMQSAVEVLNAQQRALAAAEAVATAYTAAVEST